MKKALAMLVVLGAAASANAVVTIVNNVPGSFTDISGTGTALGLSDDGSANITTTLFGSLRVGNNGAVAAPSNAGSLGFTNAALPATGTFFGGQTFLPHWDDQYGGTTALGNVWWQETSDRVIVQWTRNHYGFRGDTVSYQLQLFSLNENAPLMAQYIYADTVFAGDDGSRDGGASATIGYQNGTAAVQWSFNTAGSVSDGTVLSLVPAPGAAALLGLGGLLVGRRRR